jgi:broad specificity phosphatase PhoE
MTRILLIAAAPTPWDVEDRVVGNHSQPLTLDAHRSISALIAGLVTEVTAVYRYKENEACDETAKLIAKKFNLRPGNNAGLDEINLGLWQGLRRDEIRFRFPKVVEIWQKQPLAIEPPEGEMIPDAASRILAAARSIIKRNRGGTVAFAVRPIAMQIISGYLRREPLEQTVTHLHTTTPMENIELSDEDVRQLLG